MVRLWHDDVRPAPEGWIWARTNDDAKRILGTGVVGEISLDHDLGWHEYAEEDMDADTILAGIPPKWGEETGMDLVHWMIAHDLVPEKITIHSWNPGGAKRMAAALNGAGHGVVVAPFTAK